MTIFGVPWNDLEFDHVAAFLADADTEPLLWEAKGTDITKGEVRKQVCGFANSHDGGYLILGADCRQGAWQLDGAEFDDEPPTWVSNVVGNASVTPYPDGLDTRAWDTTAGRSLAVVRILPTPTPPCNTNGTVYERVSGRTIPVRETLRLAGLFERGDQARTRARDLADRDGSWGLGQAHSSAPYVGIGLGIVATGYRSDLTTRLFTESFCSRCRDDHRRLPHRPAGGRPFAPTIQRQVSQTEIRFECEPGHDFGAFWKVAANWEGLVAITWRRNTEHVQFESVVHGPMKQAWEAGLRIGDKLGAQGSRYLCLYVGGGLVPTSHPIPRAVARGPLGGTVDQDVLAGISRELWRSVGRLQHEPEA
jgi:hypothetical protein